MDDLYLDNIDEYVNDQNKIVSRLYNDIVLVIGKCEMSDEISKCLHVAACLFTVQGWETAKKCR